MVLEVKYKNGLIEIQKVSKLSFQNKNPCINCRKDGGCYDHGCFMPEDWGDFLISENNSIRIQDTQEIKIKEF